MKQNEFSPIKPINSKNCPNCGETDPTRFRVKTLPTGTVTFNSKYCKKCEAAKYARPTREKLTKDILSKLGMEVGDVVENIDIHVDESDNIDKKTENIANALIELAHYDENLLDAITEEEFYDACEKAKEYLAFINVSFLYLKDKAHYLLQHKHGYKYPTMTKLGEGTYIVVGDSHGKHTKHKTFDMLERLNKHLKATNIIHVGHILDDDDILSYRWKDIKNLLIVAKKEEIRRLIKLQAKDDSYKLKIIRNEIYLGNLCVRNQDLYTNEYTYVSLNALDQNINESHTLFNFHRHEMTSKTTPEDKSLLHMGVGCLCEPFVVETRRLIDWLGGGGIRDTYSDSFSTYRRRGEISKIWEQGIYIVNVDKNKNFTVVPCRIKAVDNDSYGVAYLDKIITSKKICKADKINLVTSDAHVPLHSEDIFDIIDQLCKDIRFDNHINLGDNCNTTPLNHHEMSVKNIERLLKRTLLYEYANAQRILEMTRNWAKHAYLIFANHERFARDFVMKWPQFKELLDINTLLDLEKADIQLIEHKESLILDNCRYLHGDIKGYGTGGSIFDKLGKIYNSKKMPIFIGHIHYPGIRGDVYSVAQTGKKDQEYNEPMASRWMNGLGQTMTYAGTTWCTTIPIINNVLILNGTVYRPSAVASKKWKPISTDNIKFKLNYEFN